MAIEPIMICCETVPSAMRRVSTGARNLAEFFQFERYDRDFSNTELLNDCHFVSLNPVRRVIWSGQPGPADPSVFSDLFAEIIESLRPAASELYLHPKGLDPQFLEEVSFVKEAIQTLGAKYMLLSPLSATKKSDFGNLLFECPSHFLPFFTDSRYHGNYVDIEGYVVPSGELGRVVDCYFRPDSVETIRHLLSVLVLGFRIWSDFNGMDIFSERYSAGDIARMVPNCTTGPLAGSL